MFQNNKQPSYVKNFISDIKDGYFSKNGSEELWRKSMGFILKNSETMAFVLSVAAGSLLRKALPETPGGVIHISGDSSVGKTQVLRAAMSLRANPMDMTWCFDSVSTLKWYTVAADKNFLCLDDIHMAIIPDNGSAKPVPELYLKQVCEQAPGYPQTTIFTVSTMPLKEFVKNSDSMIEINTNLPNFTIWPYHADRDIWWMDEPMYHITNNYGFASELIEQWISSKGFSISSTYGIIHERWLNTWNEYKGLNSSKQGLLLLSYLGEILLNEIIFSGKDGIELQSFRKKLV